MTKRSTVILHVFLDGREHNRKELRRVVYSKGDEHWISWNGSRRNVERLGADTYYVRFYIRSLS